MLLVTNVLLLTRMHTYLDVRPAVCYTLLALLVANIAYSFFLPIACIIHVHTHIHTISDVRQTGYAGRDLPCEETVLRLHVGQAAELRVMSEARRRGVIRDLYALFRPSSAE
jgi:hypothetical protein